jgi:hypothetical protein
MEKTDSNVVTTGFEPVLESQSPDEGKPTSTGFLARLNERVSPITCLEERGIEPESERHEVKLANYMQITLPWFSTDITANNIAVGAVGMLGPLDYELGFTDAVLCNVFGAVLGAIGYVHEYV